jgi:predicted  nucleic acid-binding Zn-ribbon protein
MQYQCGSLFVELKPIVKEMAKTTKKESAPAAKKPAAKKVAAKKPVAKKVAAKKPVAKKAPVEKKAAVIKPKPAIKKEVAEEKVEQKVERTLMALYSLQQFDSQIDKIRIIRGELPLEVQDLEDEIVGLETRVNNHGQDIESVEKNIKEKQENIKRSLELIKKYEDQQMNVRNNREYDSLSKEIEFQTLEIQLAEKKINENKLSLENKKQEIEVSELTDIVTETEKEEDGLITMSKKQHSDIEDRLLTAYQRIRKNARNGLAVVKIERDACGGCFNKIPPQHQLDIMMHKKIIVCEYCGRILVDNEIANAVDVH